jgi:PleD family two-component response regulator
MPTVLIVDDHRAGIESLADVLEDHDFRTFGATSGEEALRLLESGREHPDCILLDSVLPGMSGLELCERLKKNSATARIPVIFLTGKRNDATIVQALDAGAADYLSKPVRIPELIARIQAALREKALHEAAAGAPAADAGILHGREALVERVRDELRRSMQLRRPVTCMVLQVRAARDADHKLTSHDEQRIQDRLLSELKGSWRESDVYARLPGLRSAMVVCSPAERGGKALAQRLQDRLAQTPVALGAGSVQVALAAGIAQAPADETVEAEELVSRAEQALQDALSETGSSIVIWTPKQ